MSFYDEDLNSQNQSGQISSGDWEETPVQPHSSGKGPWHFVLTLVTLASATLASAGIAVLFSDVEKRSWWQMGLTFFAPAAAVAFGAYLVENSTNAMTPRLSRKAQSLVALAVALVSFIIGSAGIPREEPVITKKTQDNIIILMDLSLSMGYPDTPERFPDSVRAIKSIYDSLDEGTYFGLVQFQRQIVGTVPFAPKDQAQKKQVEILLENKPGGGTEFDISVEEALNMVEKAALPPDEKVSVIMVTDADDDADISNENVKYFVDKAKRLGVSLSYLQLENIKPSSLEKVVAQTGGQSLLVSQSSQLLDSMTKMITSQVEVFYDVLRDDNAMKEGINQHSTIMSAAMLSVLGLLLGFSLSLMLSHHGQKRWQLVISPLMGVLAFVIIKLHPGPLMDVPPAYREAIGFSLYGVVLMRKNNLNGVAWKTSGKITPQNPSDADFLGTN